MYPTYDYAKLRSDQEKRRINVLILLSIIVSRFIPMYLAITMGSLYILYMIRKIMKKDLTGFDKINEMRISLIGVIICYDLLDLEISWSLSIVLPIMMIILTTVLTILILVNKHAWDMYYQNHMYFIIIILLLTGLCMIGYLQFNFLLVNAMIFTGLSILIVFLKYGRDYVIKLKHFSHL